MDSGQAPDVIAGASSPTDRGTGGFRATLICGLALSLVACGDSARSAPTQSPPPATSVLPGPASVPGATTALPSPPVHSTMATGTATTAGVLDLPTLGGTKAAWVRAKGAPTRAALGDLFDQNVAITFSPAPDGHERATRIELLLGHTAGLGDRSGVPIAQARDMAQSFHPPDARAVRTYTAEESQMVEVFESDLLAEALAGLSRPPAAAGPSLGDAPAGTYIQIAGRGGPTTNRVVLTVGDRP